MGNKPSQSQSESEGTENSRLPPSGPSSRHRDPAQSIEEGEDLEVGEVPPPMRPISSIPAPEDSKARVRMRVISSCHLTRVPSSLSSCHRYNFFFVTQIFLHFIKLEKLIVQCPHEHNEEPIFVAGPAWPVFSSKYRLEWSVSFSVSFSVSLSVRLPHLRAGSLQ